MCIKFTLSLNVGSLPHFIHEMKTPEGTAQANRPRTPHLSDISSFYASIVVSPLLDGPHASFISSFYRIRSPLLDGPHASLISSFYRMVSPP